MKVAARLKGAKLSAQKARLVADQIRGKKVGEALDLLSFSSKKGAHLVKKLLTVTKPSKSRFDEKQF